MTTHERLQRARAEIAAYNELWEWPNLPLSPLFETFYLGNNMYGDILGNKWSFRTCPPIEEVVVRHDHRSLLLYNIQTKGTIL